MPRRHIQGRVYLHKPHHRKVSTKEKYNFICMACGCLFPFSEESTRQHICKGEACLQYRRQRWGVIGYPPHRYEDGFKEDQIANPPPGAPTGLPPRHNSDRGKPTPSQAVYKARCRIPDCTRKGVEGWELCSDHLRHYSLYHTPAPRVSETRKHIRRSRHPQARLLKKRTRKPLTGE